MYVVCVCSSPSHVFSPDALPSPKKWLQRIMCCSWLLPYVTIHHHEDYHHHYHQQQQHRLHLWMHVRVLVFQLSYRKLPRNGTEASWDILIAPEGTYNAGRQWCLTTQSMAINSAWNLKTWSISSGLLVWSIGRELCFVSWPSHTNSYPVYSRYVDTVSFIVLRYC